MAIVATLKQLSKMAPAEVMAVPEKNQKWISSLINNLPNGSLKRKSNELKDLLKGSNYGWFSHYSVVRHVIVEPKNHEPYLSLLDEINLQDLNDTIIEETFASIKLLFSIEQYCRSLF